MWVENYWTRRTNQPREQRKLASSGYWNNNQHRRSNYFQAWCENILFKGKFDDQHRACRGWNTYADYRSTHSKVEHIDRRNTEDRKHTFHHSGMVMNCRRLKTTKRTVCSRDETLRHSLVEASCTRCRPRAAPRFMERLFDWQSSIESLCSWRSVRVVRRRTTSNNRSSLHRQM